MGEILVAVAMFGAAVLGIPTANHQQPQRPQVKTMTPSRIAPLPGSMMNQHPMVVHPRYPIPDPKQYPGKVINGVEFHYVPVAK